MIHPILSGGLGLVLGASHRPPWWSVAGIVPSSCVAAYQPKGAASLVASYINLANPGTYDATPGVAPTWATGTGWAFDGAMQYLTTGIVPASGWSIICQFAGGSGVVTMDVCGLSIAAAPTKRFYLRPRHGASHSHVYGYGSAANIVASRLAAGNMGLAGSACYLNGVPDGIAGVWVNTTAEIYIGCENNGAPAAFWNGSISALGVYSTTISAAQMLALYNAMSLL
jgi:hypothetical protein